MSKPKIIKDYDKLNEDILAQIKLEYPLGFQKKLITFKNKDGKFVTALPFETDNFYYLVRMTRSEAKEIVEQDEDYDEYGILTEEAKDRLEDELTEDTIEE